MRRLPIFFVIDVSESMIGEPINEVGKGMKAMIQSLRQDPYALDTAYISVIVFAGKSKTLVPLTDIISFYPPQFPVGGGTSLGAAIQHLIGEMDLKLVKNDGETKGDWKPIIFLFTDGVPTDETAAAVSDWETKYKNKVNLIAISIGANADVNLLNRLTEQVLLFDDTSPETYKEFFKWITASISTQSQKVENSSDDQFQLEKLDDNIAKKINLDKDNARFRVDENFVVLHGKCQRTNAPYLIKFKRNVAFDEWADIIEEGYGGATERAFSLAGAFAIPSPEDYAELSLENTGQAKINTAELAGNPSCPCCGNQFGFGSCACGGIHCIHGLGANRCPWCGQTSNYGFGGEDEDISRGLG